MKSLIKNNHKKNKFQLNLKKYKIMKILLKIK